MMETSMGSSVFCIDSKLPNTQTVQTVYQKPTFPSFHDCHNLLLRCHKRSYSGCHSIETYTAHSKIGSIYVQTVYDTFK